MRKKDDLPIYDVEGGNCKAVFVRDKIFKCTNLNRIRKLLKCKK